MAPPSPSTDVYIGFRPHQIFECVRSSEASSLIAQLPLSDLYTGVQLHQTPEEVNPNMRKAFFAGTWPETCLRMGVGIDSDPDGVSSQTVDPSAQAAAAFIDGSNLLFSMYNETTAEHDRKVAENWRSDADSAVIVVRRHFSLPLSYHCA